MGTDYTKVPDAAAVLGVDEETVRRGIRRGRIPAKRLSEHGPFLIPNTWLFEPIPKTYSDDTPALTDVDDVDPEGDAS